MKKFVIVFSVMLIIPIIYLSFFVDEGEVRVENDKMLNQDISYKIEENDSEDLNDVAEENDSENLNNVDEEIDVGYVEDYVLYIDDTAEHELYKYRVIDSDKNYTIEREINTNDKYRVTVFNDSGVIFKNVFFGSSPVVKMLDDNLVQIFKIDDKGDNFSIFVDTEKSVISNGLSIRNPAFIINERVLGVEQMYGTVYVTFTSLFDVNAPVSRYELKNADSSNIVADIEDVGYSDDNTIVIKYLDVDGNVQSQKIKVSNVNDAGALGNDKKLDLINKAIYEEQYGDVPFLKNINYDMGIYKKNAINPFFFSDDLELVKYESYIYPLSFNLREDEIDLKINILKEFEDGKLYTLELMEREFEDEWDKISMGKQYLGYFYVNKEGIYLSAGTMDGYPEEETDKLINIIMNDRDNFLDYFYLVCSDEEMEIVDGEWVYKIEINGDERTFKAYSTYVSGTRLYLLITWELNKGIVHYINGDGSMRMHTEFGTDLENQRYENIHYYPYFPQ